MIERIPLAGRSREDWLALRSKDVTASVVAALFGLHPYETALGVYAEKTGVVMPEPDSKVLRRGRLLEGAVAEAVRDEYPEWAIDKADEYLRDPTIRLGATPDFYIRHQGRNGILQAKTASPAAFEKNWTPEAPPTWIALQCATEMMLDDADFGFIAVLVVDGYNFDLHIYDVPRIAAVEARICNMAVSFKADLDAGRKPAADYARDNRLLAAMYPKEVPEREIDLRGDNRVPALLDQRAAALDLIATAEKSKQTIDAELREKMGDAEIAIVDGWRVRLKQVTVKEHVRKLSSSRRFFITQTSLMRA